jgi:hypothetical protein
LAYALSACTATPPISTQTVTATDVAVNSVSATSIAEQTPVAIDPAEIFILTPGDGSQVVSPIQLSALLQPGLDGAISIQLMDLQGRLRFAQVLTLNGPQLDLDVPFEISRESGQAQLTISTLDKYGRIQALNSVSLVLLHDGEANIVEGASDAYIVIDAPHLGDDISAEKLVATGRVLSQPGRPLNVQLITRAGKVLAFSEVYPTYVAGEAYGSFELEFNLNLDEPTWVQLAVSENAGTPFGMAHFKGVEVLLKP